MAAAPAPSTVAEILALLEREGLARALTLLRRPPVSSLLLQELVELNGDDAARAREFVAAYPLAPGHLLELLAQGGAALATLERLAGNPRTPPHVLAQLASHEDAGVRAAAAGHPKLPSRELCTLAGDPEPRVRAALALNDALRLPDQALLSDDDEARVRVALAGHAALSPQAALVLGADSSAVVRLHTVATARVEEEVLLGWAAAEEEDLQLALLRRPGLPKRALRLLLLSPHERVRVATRVLCEADEVALYFLCTRGTPDERAWVASRETLSAGLQCLLARDAEPAVLRALAANPALHTGVAAHLLRLGDEACCVALACNQAVVGEPLQELAATRLPAVLRALAYRRGLDPELVRALVALSPDFRRHFAQNGGTVSALDADTARALLADPLPRIRALGVTGHAWRRADLYDLARDPVALVRLAVVNHANAPEELLEDRSRDAAPEVAAAAAQALEAARARRRELGAYAASLSSPRAPGPLSFSTPAVAAPAPRIAAPQAVESPLDAADSPLPGTALITKLKRFFFAPRTEAR